MAGKQTILRCWVGSVFIPGSVVRIGNLTGLVGSGQEKWTHGQLWHYSSQYNAIRASIHTVSK